MKGYKQNLCLSGGRCPLYIEGECSFRMQAVSFSRKGMRRVRAERGRTISSDLWKEEFTLGIKEGSKKRITLSSWIRHS